MKPDKIRLRQLAKERLRRQGGTEAEKARQDLAADLWKGLTSKQQAFVASDSPQKAALCTRRAGKTWACRNNLVIKALTTPDSYSIYINTSRAECKRVLWRGASGLLRLVSDYGLDEYVDTHHTDLRMTFDNGATIQLISADDSSEIEKLRGSSYDLVVIDEAASFPNLGYFVEDILMPALGDRRGQMVLIGTPAAHCAGYFFDVTKDGDSMPGWDVHRWTYADNTFLPHLTEYFEERRKARGWKKDHPTWLREYQGKWVQSDDLLVYQLGKVPDAELYWDALPEDDASYVIGVDLGYNDPFAFVVWATYEHDPCLYEIEGFKQSGIQPSEQFEMIRSLINRYNPDVCVVDPGGALARGYIDEWNARHGMSLIPAVRVEKLACIQTFNDQLLARRIKFNKESPVADEMRLVQWEEAPSERITRYKNDRRFPDHLSDAALYGFRHSGHYVYEKTEVAPEYGSKSYWEKQAAEYKRRVLMGEDAREPQSYYEEFERWMS